MINLDIRNRLLYTLIVYLSIFSRILNEMANKRLVGIFLFVVLLNFVNSAPIPDWFYNWYSYPFDYVPVGPPPPIVGPPLPFVGPPLVVGPVPVDYAVYDYYGWY